MKIKNQQKSTKNLKPQKSFIIEKNFLLFSGLYVIVCDYAKKKYYYKKKCITIKDLSLLRNWFDFYSVFSCLCLLHHRE